MEIISKNKKKGVTEVQFGDKAKMLEKLRKIISDTGYMVRPKINPNLKIMSPYDTPKYDAAKKSGLFNKKKQEELDKKVKRGEAI